ncbi:helix-turn-helix domain-containing protein [Parablautia sp. Marseille-Q6255]|uniref:helix-turn-helix domain-containing protein n=1 Tax=Parablautia sp. Marseille-Q6255 TaxID=3039593 RepID=UPI0024BD2CE0|nr:helix-turn-helix domain-containing protein [Parablautia sp. Marseille-Q6255]
MEKIVICDMIKELRKKAGYTQAQVSQMLNIQRQTYCNYENATRTPPLEIITALADLYHVSMDYLILGSGETAQLKPVQDTENVLNPDEQTLINIFSKLSEQSQKEIITFAQYKKLFTE